MSLVLDKKFPVIVVIAFTLGYLNLRHGTLRYTWWSLRRKNNNENQYPFSGLDKINHLVSALILLKNVELTRTFFPLLYVCSF